MSSPNSLVEGYQNQKSAYAKKTRGAIYKSNQENSLLGKLKKQIRTPASAALGKKMK